MPSSATVEAACWDRGDPGERGRDGFRPGPGVADPVLDAGVGAVPGFEERELSGGGVGGDAESY